MGNRQADMYETTSERIEFSTKGQDLTKSLSNKRIKKDQL